MGRCTKCSKDRPVDQFSFKSKATGQRHTQCKDCTRLLIRGHYAKNKKYYLDKTKTRNDALKFEIIRYLKSYFSENPCVDCGESDFAVLEFDHRGQIPKLMAVSSLIRARYPIDKIKDEIKKCDVRCANCHRKKTARDFKWLKSNDALVA